MTPPEQKALEALRRVIPLLEKHRLAWAITGGFACYVYGVARDITDIDIDVDANKDSEAFKAFMDELNTSITQPLEHFVDQNYDNYNFEATFDGQIVDICPMNEMRIFNQSVKAYVPFYRDGFPATETVDFHGMPLHLLSKELIIRNKEMLAWKRESDLRDIRGLKRMIRR